MDNVLIDPFPNRNNFQGSYCDDGGLHLSKISKILSDEGEKKVLRTVQVYSGSARGGLSQ